MARKKRTAAKKTKRRIGAAPSGGVQNLLMMIVGGVAANYVTKILPDAIGSTDISKFKNAIPVVVGFFGPKFIKNKTLQPLFNGMVVGGAISLLRENGIGGVGYAEAPMLGYMEQRRLAGVDMENIKPQHNGAPFLGAVGL